MSQSPLRDVLLALLACACVGAVPLSYGAVSQGNQACDSGGGAPAHIEGHFGVLIDETFKPTPESEKWVTSALHALAHEPGIMIQIAGFSQSPGGTAGPIVGAPLYSARTVTESDRVQLGRRELASRIRCAALEQRQLDEEVATELRRLIGKEVKPAHRTEIAASFQLIGRAFQGVPARWNLLVVVSDGLEANPDQLFYADKTPRLIDPVVELERLKKRHIEPSLAGVDVIWAGIGTAPRIMAWREFHALQTYWTQAIAVLGGHPLEVDTVPALPVTAILNRARRGPEQIHIIELHRSTAEGLGPG